MNATIAFFVDFPPDLLAPTVDKKIGKNKSNARQMAAWSRSPTFGPEHPGLHVARAGHRGAVATSTDSYRRSESSPAGLLGSGPSARASPATCRSSLEIDGKPASLRYGAP